MNKSLLHVAHFRGKREQPLHNVFIHAPTLYWVEQGRKQLWWQEQSYEFNRANWLVVPAGQYLTFVNTPMQNAFNARAVTFFQPPPAEWLNEEVSLRAAPPMVKVTDALRYCFEIICDMSNKNLSAHTQQQLLLAFYAELRHIDALHLLFPSENQLVRDKLATYLSAAPGDDHKIEIAAQHLAMSRATLTRKLAAEETSFRHILTEIRMSHALGLLQRKFSQMDTALACGYQSEVRFTQRFKEQFGLTPRQYQMTL
ncbi:helix-turn-helix transcriptional regulator [Vibrio scophthalmi]|uniref:helix-turn-helix transcriptional regulator n=1 Tax=Vibrio scophthalmi TaxID=45658 RepID=UPI0038734846